MVEQVVRRWALRVHARLAAIITYGHFDHVGAVEDLTDEWGLAGIRLPA
jgi:glyoxylase-like metal-dependent hydrolase (beta-lactamase superfamily II)